MNQSDSSPGAFDRERRVNIIFVGGTVEVCMPFLRSLIDRTRLPLRIVANGCDRREERLLIRLCKDTARLRYYSLGSATVVMHGDALDHLLARERSDLFSFMDSDIFATGPVSMTDIEPPPGEVASTSCLPVWHTAADALMPESFQIMGGRYINSATGHFLGCTYLACYRTSALRQLIDATGLSFRFCRWDDVAPDIAAKLADLRLTKQIYDTAKVVNLMLQLEGHKMSYREIDGLVHVGGVSAPGGVGPVRLKRALRRAMPGRLYQTIIMRRMGIDRPEAASLANLGARRRRALELTRALTDGPPLSRKVKQLVAREGYAKSLAELYAAYRVGDAAVVGS